MSLVTVTHLRKHQWDKSNNWDINVEGIFFGNSRVFPANDTELTFFGIENESIGSTGLEMAKTRTRPNVTLSYIDDENLSITKQFTDWQRTIVSMDGYEVLPLSDACRFLNITKLNSMKEPLFKWRLKGYPTGTIQYHGDSDGSVPFYSVNFVITEGALDWTK